MTCDDFLAPTGPTTGRHPSCSRSCSTSLRDGTEPWHMPDLLIKPHGSPGRIHVPLRELDARPRFRCSSSTQRRSTRATPGSSPRRGWASRPACSMSAWTPAGGCVGCLLEQDGTVILVSDASGQLRGTEQPERWLRCGPVTVERRLDEACAEPSTASCSAGCGPGRCAGSWTSISPRASPQTRGTGRKTSGRSGPPSSRSPLPRGKVSASTLRWGHLRAPPRAAQTVGAAAALVRSGPKGCGRGAAHEVVQRVRREGCRRPPPPADGQPLRSATSRRRSR